MRIINFGQVVDLEHGMRIAHQFTVETDGGQRLQIRTDESTVQQLVESLTGASNGAQQAPQPKQTLGEILAEEQLGEIQAQDGSFDPDAVFGGDYDPGELANEALGALSNDSSQSPESIMGAVSEEPVMDVVPTGGGIGQAKAPVRKRPPVDADGFFLPPKAKTVPKDAMGYPIVQQRTQPAAVEEVEDEDGHQI